VPVIGLQQYIDGGIDDDVPEIVDKEDTKEYVMVDRIARDHFGRAWEEKEQQKGRPGDDPGDPQHQLFVPDPFPQFIEHNEESEYEHAELEQEAELVVRAQQALDKYIFVHSQHTEDDPFDRLVKQVEPESFALCGVQLDSAGYLHDFQVSKST
jgi:hypothetical protein